MHIPYAIGGMMNIELTSATLHETLSALLHSGIEVHDWKQQDPLTGSFWIHRRHCSDVFQICERRDGCARILQKSGLYWLFSTLIHRLFLLSGLAVILILFAFLPTRVLFVQVEGNQTVPTRQILAEAEKCGIRFGSSRRSIRSEKVKNFLLSQIPQLQWAGVNTSGCVATISVRESVLQAQSMDVNGVSSIVAKTDGYILSATAAKGTLLVKPGDTVQAGQLLISGYTDCGRTIRAEAAQGEIYAQTNRKLSVITPAKQGVKRYTGSEYKKISLLFGKKRINLWKDSGISLYSCGRMYKEYYITLPGGFQLPIALCMERYPVYLLTETSVSPDEVQPSLMQYAEQSLTEQMSAGAFLQKSYHLLHEENAIRYIGNFVCQEMIGRVRIEQIGEENGKNSGTNR